MEVVQHTYPIPPAARMGIIELLQREWARTDVDWLQSMRGAYSQTLRTRVALARVGGDAVGTASIAFACEHPGIGVVEDVMTLEDFRGLGIAATLTEGLVQQAWEAGCRVVYLGNSPRQVSVYEKIVSSDCSGLSCAGRLQVKPSPKRISSPRASRPPSARPTGATCPGSPA